MDTCYRKTIRPMVRLAVLALAFVAPQVASAFPSQQIYGVTVYDPAKATPGPVIFTSPEAAGITYVIDIDGNVIREVTSPFPDTTIAYAKPLANGNILARLRTPVGAPEALVELTLNGDAVWAFATQAYRPHHDQLRLPNGNTLILCSRNFTMPVISDKEIQDDCLIEVDPAGSIVWTWQTAQHFHEFGFSDEVKANIFDYGGDWAHANAIDVIPSGLANSDPRFAPGNIIISYRHINAIVVVDRATGAIATWFDNVTVGQHNPQMIGPGLPGEGNILVFDNGYSDPVLNPGAAGRNGAPTRDHSLVVEFDPLNPQDPAWEYKASMSGLRDTWFFSSFISAAQRMPNGNTFITEGMNGRFFEVTPTGEIVWEYVSPFFAVRQGQNTNQVYRAHKAPTP